MTGTFAGNPHLKRLLHDPVIATGHQTLLWHPGILVKYLLTDAIARVHGLAAANLVVGRKEGALDWLEKAYEERAWSLIFLRRRIYDPLRSDPRFRDLYRRVGLEAAVIPPRAGPQLERDALPATTDESGPA